MATKTEAKPETAGNDSTEVVDLTGTIRSIVYRSEQSGYTVCAVQVPGSNDPITVVGTCAAVWVGESIKVQGKWVRHKQHGRQLQAESMICVAPTSARGIERYLASGMIKGIGQAIAEKLVSHFGTETLNIIEKESQRLEEVEGIGPVKRKRIKESWIEQKAVRDIMIFLQGHGVGTAQAARIYRHYGNQAIALIQANPYRLCADIWGIGFKTADGVAMSIGIPPQSPARARAGIVHILQTMIDDGHCYCPTAELILAGQALLDIPAEILTEALAREIADNRLVQEDEHIFLTEIQQAEQQVAAKLHHLLTTPFRYNPIDADKAIPWAEQRMGVTFAPLQTQALGMALREKVSIITGGPGVGKTTIIRALVDVFGARRLNVGLAAPTGRAAKRMEEATHREAKTIHRLLKYNPQLRGFEHGPDNPLEGDIYIVDEVSMVDLPLMAELLGALPDAAGLILVGDIDQLPSVGPGNVLRDLINSDVIPFRKLEYIFRQEQSGLIVRNAHHVNEGQFIEVPDEGQASDFYFIESDEPDQTIQRLIDLVVNRIPRRFGFDMMREIQVLTPMRRNQLGAENLNQVLQEAMNPIGESTQRMGRTYRIGDRVMQIRNNYDKEVYNGDIGIIRSLDADDQRLQVDYEGRTVNYDFTDLDELLHAYACSIHKSQGSEYPAIVIVIATQHYKLLQRNLLYTGITRGKRLVCLLGSRKAVAMAIRNNTIRMRRTGLRQRLVDFFRNQNQEPTPTRIIIPDED